VSTGVNRESARQNTVIGGVQLLILGARAVLATLSMSETPPFQLNESHIDPVTGDSDLFPAEVISSFNLVG
jgi:hypothetical protein